MSPAEQPLTRRQGVLIASRVVCILCLFYSVSNLLALPDYLAGLMHYRAGSRGPTSGTYYTYWTSKYVGYVGGSLLRAVTELWLAGVFYRCGPRMSRFFLRPEEETPVSPPSA